MKNKLLYSAAIATTLFINANAADEMPATTELPTVKVYQAPSVPQVAATAAVVEQPAPVAPQQVIVTVPANSEVIVQPSPTSAEIPTVAAVITAPDVPTTVYMGEYQKLIDAGGTYSHDADVYSPNIKFKAE